MGIKTDKVDLYIEGLEPGRRVALSELRSVVLETVPDAVETMRYRMPTYELEGGVLCSIASQKHYMSLYMDTDSTKAVNGTAFSSERQWLAVGAADGKIRTWEL
jgi:uncharacterized protein YdhG (YjbR/CyaY superfamily)